MFSIAPHIRPMIKRDLLPVLDIEQQTTVRPWSENDFLEYMKYRYNQGWVAEYREKVLGFMLYQDMSPKSEFLITELAVYPDFQRRGVGTTLIEQLIDNALNHGIGRLTYYAIEDNLPAQLFLSVNDFRAVKVHKDFYSEIDDDVYEMRLTTLFNRMSSNDSLVTGSES